MFAVTNGDLEIVQVLIEAGADPHQATVDGKTPLSFAEANASQGIVAILRTRLVKKDEPSGGKTDQHKRVSPEDQKGGNKDSRARANEMKPDLDHNDAKAEYSKMSKERAMKEKKAREQAQKEQEGVHADAVNLNKEQIDTKNNKPSSIFSFFGM
jgi:hypothetical protein